MTGKAVMDLQTTRKLYENALGELAAKYLESLDPEEIRPLMESRALELISQIKSILDDETLEDPGCFRRIDAMVDAFHDHGVPVSRHDW